MTTEQFTLFRIVYDKGEMEVSRETFDAELVDEGMYEQRFEAPQITEALKQYTDTYKGVKPLRTEDFHKCLDRPFATLTDTGMIGYYLFMGNQMKEDTVIVSKLKEYCLSKAYMDCNKRKEELGKAAEKLHASVSRHIDIRTASNKLYFIKEKLT